MNLSLADPKGRPKNSLNRRYTIKRHLVTVVRTQKAKI
jgi:hypothetical protein